MKKIIKRVFIIILAAVLAALLGIFIFNRIMQKVEERLFKEPLGQMVEVDGHKMCLHVEGEGKRTIVFLSGSGTASPILDFKSLYDLLKEDYRIVVIEKFGYGFSDVVDGERSFDTILRQDREALVKAGVEGPYVLCPHSMSALEAILWAQEYPNEVDAIIGLDMAVPEAYDVLDLDGAIRREKFAAVLREMGIARLYYNDANIPGNLSKEEKKLYRAIGSKIAVNKVIINETKAVRDACDKIAQNPKPNVPTLLFVSNGEGTGVKEGWLDAQKNYAKDLRTSQVIELDCAHYVHDFEYESISQEMKSFISELKIRPTREYFENVNKDYTLEQMFAELGPYGVEGSGIIRFLWKLDDGSTASVIFSSYGIEEIYIRSESGSELIYDRRAPSQQEDIPTQEDVSLKDACSKYFMLGVGINGSTLDNLTTYDEEYMAMVKKHFNSVTLSNLMKPCYILQQKESQNSPDGLPVLDFTTIDDTLRWCQDNGVKMRGHTLVWHTQTPGWFFREGYLDDGKFVDKETMLARMESYIKQMMNHVQEYYPGVVYCWDVVNEAVDPDKGDKDSFFLCRTELDGEPNPWYVTIGPEYVEAAFRFARQFADEDVKLFYNDFNTFDTRKRTAIYALCEDLKAKDLIDGIGMQGYWGIDYPNITAITSAISIYARLELEIQITELSVGVDEETEEQFEKQAKRYRNIFLNLKAQDTQGGGSANITSVTFFGLKDHYVEGDKTNARLFDKDLNPKPAFNAVRDIFKMLYQD